MVVDDFDIPCRTVAPYKANAPLIVDSNAVLPAAIASQSFQPITGRCTQIIKSTGRIDHQEFLPCTVLNGRRKTANGTASKERGSSFVGEAPEHSLP